MFFRDLFRFTKLLWEERGYSITEFFQTSKSWLDLQGGSHLLLEVETTSVLKEESENLVDEIGHFSEKLN